MKLGEIKHLQPAFGNAGGPCWEITARPDVMMRLKRILPKVETKRSGAVLVTDTPSVAHELRWILDMWALEMHDLDRQYLERCAGEYIARQEGIQRLLAGDRPADDFQEPSAHVDEYQLQAADLALMNGGLLLADDLGMGKTFSALLMLRDPKALPALIVVPTHLTKQWQEELAALLPWLRSHIVRTVAVYEPATKREMKGHEPDVLITSYSKLYGWADHLAGEVSTVIFDECQELRVDKSRKTIAAGQIADAANYRMGLSATPVFNYGGEIYNILDVLAPNYLGSRQEFAREWGVARGEVDVSGGTRSVKAKALGEYLRAEGLLLRRTWRDVGRERPEIPIKIPHAIDADAELIEEATSNARALAELILNRGGTQQEIFEAERDLDNKIRQATGVAKAPHIASFLKMLLETEDKVVVFAWHRAVYSILLEELADFNPVLYTGSESGAGKRRAKEAFTEGDSRLLLISLRSGAGLNGLQLASHVAVFAELDWSPAMHDQCVGRLARPGQKNQVLAYYLLAETGCDPAMAEILNVKRMQSEPIRDPDADLLEAAPDISDRVKRLAESVLQRRDLRTRPSGRPAGKESHDHPHPERDRDETDRRRRREPPRQGRHEIGEVQGALRLD